MTSRIPDSITQIITVLTSHSYRASNEAVLQSALAKVLDKHHVMYERERRIGARDRIDFYVTASCGQHVGIEVKVQGALSAVAMQLHRYAESPDVDTLILATTLNRLTAIPDEMVGKSVYAVRLSSGMF